MAQKSDARMTAMGGPLERSLRGRDDLVFKSLDQISQWPWNADFFPHLIAAVALGGILVLFYAL